MTVVHLGITSLAQPPSGSVSPWSLRRACHDNPGTTLILGRLVAGELSKWQVQPLYKESLKMFKVSDDGDMNKKWPEIQNDAMMLIKVVSIGYYLIYFHLSDVRNLFLQKFMGSQSPHRSGFVAECGRNMEEYQDSIPFSGNWVIGKSDIHILHNNFTGLPQISV